ncbi:MAG: hypothetical protein HUU35_12975, partial [Armatimonadetes bacterium]|nr:hypothetical protein [Armatimonadota bacterium]
MAPEVLFINHVGVVGGAEESLLVLLGALDPARYRARLAAPSGELAVRAAALEVPCWPLPPGRLRRGSPVQRVRSLAWLGTVA